MTINRPNSKMMNESKKSPASSDKEDLKNMKILGVVFNLNDDGKTYYICSKDDNYYLFVGSQCLDAAECFNYDM